MAKPAPPTAHNPALPPQGFFGPDTSGPCEECPANSYCPGGAVLKINHASPKLACPEHSTSAAGQEACICGAVRPPPPSPATLPASLIRQSVRTPFWSVCVTDRLTRGGFTEAAME